MSRKVFNPSDYLLPAPDLVKELKFQLRDDALALVDQGSWCVADLEAIRTYIENSIPGNKASVSKAAGWFRKGLVTPALVEGARKAREAVALSGKRPGRPPKVSQDQGAEGAAKSPGEGV